MACKKQINQMYSKIIAKCQYDQHVQLQNLYIWTTSQRHHNSYFPDKLWLASCLDFLLHLFLDCVLSQDMLKLLSSLTQFHQVFLSQPVCLAPATGTPTRCFTHRITSTITCPNHVNLLFLITKNHNKFCELGIFLPYIPCEVTYPYDHTHFSFI